MMARYQPQGGRGLQPRGQLPPRRPLPPAEPPLSQRALTALLLGSLSLIGLMFGLGCIGLVFSALWLLVLAVFWPQLNTYYNCMGGANTMTAQQTCHDQFTKSVGSEIGMLQNGRLRVYSSAPQ